MSEKSENGEGLASNEVLRTLMLRRALPEQERNEKAADVARLDTEILALEEEKAAFDKKINGDIKALKEQRDPLALEVHRGQLTPVDCTIVLDAPERGMKVVTPLDTNEAMAPERMVSGDYQDQLPLDQRALRECGVREDGEPCEPIDPESQALQNCRHCGKFMDELLDPDNEGPVTELPADDHTQG